MVFCLIHLIPFSNVPTDNCGAGYAVRLPASVQPRTIFEFAPSHHAEPRHCFCDTFVFVVFYKR